MIEIELESAVGPRVLFDDEDESEVEAEIPKGWRVSWETTSVRTTSGRWSAPLVHDQDARRTKPRVSLVLAPEERKAADALATARGLSLSTLVGQLLRAEADRERRRGIK